MSRKSHPFVVSEADVAILDQLTAKGKESVRKINRARALRFSHQGQKPEQISEALNISVSTVYNLRRRYEQHGLQGALSEKPRPGQPRKVTPEVEAEITAIACGEAPEGSVRWTVGLINQRLIKLDIHLDDESVRLVLKKANSNPGSKSNGASGR